MADANRAPGVMGGGAGDDRIRAVARRALRSDADLILIAAPRGFKKSALPPSILAANDRAFAVDLGGATSESELDHIMVEKLLEVTPLPEVVDDKRARTVVFRRPEALFRRALTKTLIGWIRVLLPFARIVIISRIVPEALTVAFADRMIERIDASALAFRADPSELERLGISSVRAREITDEYGDWPAAWLALLEAREAGLEDLNELARADLADMVDAEIASLEAGREAVLTLAVLGRATLAEIISIASCEYADARCAIEQLNGYVLGTPDDILTMPSFFRMRCFARYPAETTAIVGAAISQTSGHDPLRALTIALERDDSAAAHSVLDGRPRSERDRLMAEASDLMGAEYFLGDDALFLSWWRMPRAHRQSVALLERLLSMRDSPVPEIRARRDLAIALYSIQSHRIAAMTHQIEALVNRPELSAKLQSLARAKLAWLHAWQGNAEEFERLLPTLDREHPDSTYAIDRYAFVNSIGSREERRALLEARHAASAGLPDFERGTATYVAIDGFFSDDTAQFEDGMRTLRALAVNDAVLARALAYIDGEEPHLDFGSHPRFRSFAILMRAAAETDMANRLLLLRAAIANADESIEIEIRIASRIAFAYAAPRESADILNEAAGLARKIRSIPYAEAIVYAERLVTAGPLRGLARRFAAEGERPRVRLGILDGTIAGPDGEPIPIAQRQFELMAFLALHENASADREAILEAIWPDLEPTAAAHALKTAAHRIRTALGDASAIVLTPRGYRLPESIETDVQRLETILAEIASTDVTARLGGVPTTYRQFAIAIEQVRDGISRWAWSDRYLPRLDSLLRRLAQVIAARADGTGRFEYTQRVVADLRSLDDADTTAFELAIASHLAAGNQIAARREFLRYTETLKAFGGEPPAAMAELFAGSQRSPST